MSSGEDQDLDENANPTATCVGDCPAEAAVHSSWRLTHSQLLPLPLQEAYRLLFVDEEFMAEVQAARKVLNYKATEWEKNDEGKKQRILTYKVDFGIKVSSCTETQVQSELDKPGECHIVECDVANEGIPVADSFTIRVHMCLRSVKNSKDQCQFCSYATINYKKTVWGLLKGQLEKQAYSGIQGNHRDVAAALAIRGNSASPTLKTKRRKKKNVSRQGSFDKHESSGATTHDAAGGSAGWQWHAVVAAILALVAVHLYLYWRLAQLEALGVQQTQCPPPLEVPHSGEEVMPTMKLLQNFNSHNSRYFSDIHNMKQQIATASASLQEVSENVASVIAMMKSTGNSNP